MNLERRGSRLVARQQVKSHHAAGNRNLSSRSGGIRVRRGDCSQRR